VKDCRIVGDMFVCSGVWVGGGEGLRDTGEVGGSVRSEEGQ
jgi:hypothetical protein